MPLPYWMLKMMKPSYVAKNKSPLLIGVGKDFNVVASDAMAMLQVTDQFLELMDKEMVIVTKEKVTIKNLSNEEVYACSIHC